MDNSLFAIFLFHANGLHKFFAYCLAVAGVNINMLAPQTLGAVVRVATSAHKKTALLASEVLFGALEFS